MQRRDRYLRRVAVEVKERFGTQIKPYEKSVAQNTAPVAQRYKQVPKTGKEYRL